MSTDPSNPQRNRTTTLPPRRGQVKAQIFESIANGIVSMVSKAGELALGRNRGRDITSSASTTPPPSSSDSDADHNAS